MARTPKPKTADATGTVIVVGPERGRRRAGRRFGPEPVSIPIAELDDGDLEAIEGDPALIVSVGPAETPDT